MSAASPLDAARAQGPKTSRLFGMPLHGTYAPFLHNTITRLAGVDRTYEKMESTDMEAFLRYARSEECCGSAVTMFVPLSLLCISLKKSADSSDSLPPFLLPARPHKVAVCQHLDELTEDGRNIGACNTVIIRKGPNGERKLVGHNTE